MEIELGIEIGDQKQLVKYGKSLNDSWDNRNEERVDLRDLTETESSSIW